MWTSPGEAGASPPLAHTRRSRAHILTASATTIHENGDGTDSNRFPDCSVIPGNPSTEQTGELLWGFHETKRETTPLVDVSLGGTWTISPILRANSSIGYSQERPSRLYRRNASRTLRAGLTVALPWGLNAGANAQFRWTDYEGLEPAPRHTRDRSSREDRTRTLSLSLHKRDFTLYGFSPQVVVTHEERTSNAQVVSYDRTHGELRFVRQF